VRRGGAWYWYLNDHLPTPRKLVDTGRAVVWDGRMEPFGTTDEVVAAVEQPLRMPGQFDDASTDLDYNHFRFAVPATGRFLATDPAQSAAIMADPRTLFAVVPALRATLLRVYLPDRTYVIADNNPLANRDPTGRDWDCADLTSCDPDADDRQIRMIQAAIAYEIDLDVVLGVGEFISCFLDPAGPAWSVCGTFFSCLMACFSSGVPPAYPICALACTAGAGFGCAYFVRECVNEASS
jgi:RHS repeat-associated protein